MSQTARQQKINEALQAFQQDPVGFMNQQPIKMNEQGVAIEACSLFSVNDIAQKNYIAVRDGFRVALGAGDEVTNDRAAFQSNDLAQNLVDELKYTDLASMEAAGLMEASLTESPWSDDYWALYTGALGKRYADPAFPDSEDWKKNHDYRSEHLASEILIAGNTTDIDRLSPSEKYDILVGDEEYQLTQAMWGDGKGYYEQHGSVEQWMGICHGWAPAAYMLDRPKNAIKVKAVDGTEITFFPSDIKALASLLWAKRMPPTRFIGGRCHQKEPAQDENGRVTDQEGFDTNPGTWHLSVVNQIGVAKRSMVLDATYDYEVWNQPVHAYSYRYFNPEAFAYAETLEAAQVQRSDVSSDRFASYRSEQAKSLVGVHMEVSYVVETDPSQHTPDTPERDMIQKVDYFYDLELDDKQQIIGGEWYMNKHPDFLWTPAKEARAVTRLEQFAEGVWPAGESVPSHWRYIAQQASASDQAPLAVIVERLIGLSRQG